MKSKLFIIILSFFIALIVSSFSFFSFGKYQFESSFLVAELRINNTPSEIKLLNRSNTNSQYPHYANKTDTITVRIQIIEEFISKINLDSNHIDIKVNGASVPVNFKYITCISESDHIYDIAFTDIPNDGDLSISFLKGTVVDKFMQNSVRKTFYLDILIDNTAPVASFSEELLDDNSSKATVTVNEGVQAIDGWNISSNKMTLSRNFSNPVEYELPIKDFAQNSASVLISIKQAKSILDTSLLDSDAN